MTTPSCSRTSRGPQARYAALLGAVALALLPGAASAQAAAEKTFAISGSATVASDYLWRGLSQTWGKPTAQLAIEAGFGDGFYVGFFGSNVAAQFIPNANLETDWIAGKRGKIGEISYDVGGVYVVYPGSNYNKASFTPALDSSSTASAELYASVSYQWLTFRVGRVVTDFFGWNLNNSGVGNFNGSQPQAGITGTSKGSMNYELTANYEPAEGWAVQGQVGRQQMPNGVDVSWSYAKLGVTRTLADGWSLGAAVWSSSDPKAFRKYGSLTGNGQTSDPARTTVVLTLAKAF